MFVTKALMGYIRRGVGGHCNGRTRVVYRTYAAPTPTVGPAVSTDRFGGRIIDGMRSWQPISLFRSATNDHFTEEGNGWKEGRGGTGGARSVAGGKTRA